MGEKQIEIRRKKSPYTQLPNKLIWDKLLRPQTKWILIAMLSLPDDWDYSIRGLAAKTGLSKDTIAKMMIELEKAGYLQRKQQYHGSEGRFGKAEYILTDVAFDFSEDGSGSGSETGNGTDPCPSLPDTVPPYTENSPQQNTILQIPPIVPQQGDGAPQQSKPKRRRQEPKESPDWKPDRFAKFWDYYPRGESKQAAIRAWDKLRPSDELIDTMAAALQRQKQRKDWQEGIGIPYASTWLNGRRWEDEEKGCQQPPPNTGQPLRGEGVRYL